MQRWWVHSVKIIFLLLQLVRPEEVWEVEVQATVIKTNLPGYDPGLSQ